MTDHSDDDNTSSVIDDVDDPIIANSNTVAIVQTSQLFRAMWSGISSQRVNFWRDAMLR